LHIFRHVGILDDGFAVGHFSLLVAVIEFNLEDCDRGGGVVQTVSAKAKLLRTTRVVGAGKNGRGHRVLNRSDSGEDHFFPGDLVLIVVVSELVQTEHGGNQKGYAGR
jgi:hypothetical protein